jgi:hypothetical protein
MSPHTVPEAASAFSRSSRGIAFAPVAPIALEMVQGIVAMRRQGPRL